MELDIEGAISQGILGESRLLVMKVAALNVVRSIFEEGTLFTSVDYFEKYSFLNCFVTLLEVFVIYLLFVHVILFYINNFDVILVYIIVYGRCVPIEQ